MSARAAARKYFCDTARGGFWRRERLFFQGSRSAILDQWPDLARNARRQHPSSLKRFSAILGRFGVGPPSITSREVADKEVRIMGSKSELLRTLVAASGGKPGVAGVQSSVLKWRALIDSNSTYLAMGQPH
jgi:hypothetical protein